MLRLSHRFTPPRFHFFRKLTGRGSGCQRLRYIDRRKALPQGGPFRIPRPPFLTGFSFSQSYHKKQEKKKESRVVYPIVFPCAARLLPLSCDTAVWYPPGPGRPPPQLGQALGRRSHGTADQRSAAPIAQPCPQPLHEIGRAQVYAAAYISRVHESEAIPSACCAAQISLKKFQKRG